MTKNGTHRSWIDRAPYDRKTVQLIQCDLARHSRWFARCYKDGRGDKAFKAKRELALRIYKVMGRVGFAEVFWRGDGGLYAAEETVNGSKVIEAARKLRKEFSAWQKSKKYADLDLSSLALRISCHSCQILIGPDPRFWSGEGLNLFCKHERELSHEGAIAITEEIFSDARKLADDFRALCVEKEFDGNDKWLVYYDRTIKLSRPVATAVARFRAELPTLRYEDVFCPSQRFAIGDAIVLHIVASPTETMDVDLIKMEEEQFRDLAERFPGWEQKASEIAVRSPADGLGEKVDMTKASPLVLRTPLTDFPIAQIEWCPVRYSRARSFHSVLGDDAAWKYMAENGVDYSENMPKRPGILVTHMVVIAQDNDLGECVILAQRAVKQRAGTTYERERWSASIEEQFNPSDVKIEATIARGLQEELLAGHADNASTSIQAIFLERRILNLAFAVVCRTSLSLGDIHQLWTASVDHDEHSQIIALPLQKDLVVECIKEGRITERARETCKRIDETTWKQTKNWELHATSAFRLGLALWNSNGL